MNEDKKNTPVVRISLASAIGQTKQMSFETYVDTVTPKDAIDGVVDKLMSVVDRQIARYELIDLEKLLVKSINEVEAMKGDLVRIDAMHVKARASDSTRVGYKLNTKEVQERQNVVTNIDARNKYLDTLRADIEKRKALVEGK